MTVEHAEKIEVRVEKFGLGLSILGRIVSTQVVDVIVLDGRFGFDVYRGLVGAQNSSGLGWTQYERCGRGLAANVQCTRPSAKCTTVSYRR